MPIRRKVTTFVRRRCLSPIAILLIIMLAVISALRYGPEYLYDRDAPQEECTENDDPNVQTAATAQPGDWSWTSRDGRRRTEHDLHEIISNHERWLDSDGRQGLRADLSHANLQGAELPHARLAKAKLDHTFLAEANLAGADLSGSDMSYAQAPIHNDQGEEVYGALSLRGADMGGANLTGATLMCVEGREANFENAMLAHAALNSANFCDANFDGADLTDAD